MRITCVVKRFDHHTESGGYDRLAAAVGANVIVRKDISGPLNTVANGIWRRLTPKKGYYTDYQFADWLAEVQALTVGYLKPPDVMHVLYNSQINLLIKRRGLLRCPLVVTFHSPFDEPGPHRFDAYPKGLGVDAAVVVARSQIVPMQRWIEPHKIFFVPLGIDTDRFRPNGDMDSAKMRILIVGEMWRDWFVMHRVIDAVNLRGLNVEFHVVTNERFFPYFNGCANTVFHSQIPEAELLNLYRSAEVLFHPVTQATSNNSVVEALACGTPVISTQIGGLPDYVSEESGWLLPPGDVAGHLDLISSLYGNRELARNRRAAARTQALKFDWRVVAQQMSAVYVAAKRSRDSARAQKRQDQS